MKLTSQKVVDYKNNDQGITVKYWINSATVNKYGACMIEWQVIWE